MMLELIKLRVQMSSVNEGNARPKAKIVMEIRWCKMWAAPSRNVLKSSEMFIIRLLVYYFPDGEESP